MRFCPPIASPLTSTTRYVVLHVHVPEFLNRQTLVNELPGVKTELSGTVRSATNSIRSQLRFGVGVRVTNGVRVGVREGVRVGVLVGVRDGVREGVDVALGVNVRVLVDVRVGVRDGVHVGVRVGV